MPLNRWANLSPYIRRCVLLFYTFFFVSYFLAFALILLAYFSQYSNLHPNSQIHQIVLFSVLLHLNSILKYFEYCTKCDVFDFDSFVKFVNIFNEKIEIGLNLIVSNNDEPVKIHLTTEYYSIERTYRGRRIRKTTYAYDIYLSI